MNKERLNALEQQCEKTFSCYVSDEAREESSTVLELIREYRKLETSKQKLIDFLENESSELHDYDNNHDLTYEGKGRMYLVDELLEKINLTNPVK